MGIINCKECGKLCNETPNRICPACYQDFLDAEIVVADYLRNHENSTIDEVHQATKVPKHIVMKMIREGRIVEGSLAYACENCRAAISSGRYCKTCEAELLDSLKPMEKKQEEPEGNGGGLHIRRLLGQE